MAWNAAPLRLHRVSTVSFSAGSVFRRGSKLARALPRCMSTYVQWVSLVQKG